MIVSNKWLRAAYGQPLRQFLSDNATVLEVVDLAGLPVFAKATVRTIMLICSPRPGQSNATRYLAPLPMEDFRTVHSGQRLQELFDQRAVGLPVTSLSPAGFSFAGRSAQRVINRMRQAATPLNTYIHGKPFFGIKTGLNRAFIIDRATRDRLIASDALSSEIIKPILAGRDIRRYGIEFKESHLIWTYVGVPIERSPAIFEHLKAFQSRLQNRWDKGDHWWELRPCHYYDRFGKCKIIYPDIATACRFALDRQGYFSSNTTYFIPGADLYLIGTLNSRLAQFYFTQVCAGLEGSGTTYLRFFGQYLEEFPVLPTLSEQGNGSAQVAFKERLVRLVEEMLSLHRRLAAGRTAQEQSVLQRQIDGTDRQIDQLVYELYGLTDQDIRIVEEGTTA
jgi:hypothetical protein